jgi:hypothetical protein
MTNWKIWEISTAIRRCSDCIKRRATNLDSEKKKDIEEMVFGIRELLIDLEQELSKL